MVSSSIILPKDARIRRYCVTAVDPLRRHCAPLVMVIFLRRRRKRLLHYHHILDQLDLKATTCILECSNNVVMATSISITCPRSQKSDRRITSQDTSRSIIFKNARNRTIMENKKRIIQKISNEIAMTLKKTPEKSTSVSDLTKFTGNARVVSRRAVIQDRTVTASDVRVDAVVAKATFDRSTTVAF